MYLHLCLKPDLWSGAAIIAFLTWAYLSGHIFLFGAYVNVSYYQLKQQQQQRQVISNGMPSRN